MTKVMFRNGGATSLEFCSSSLSSTGEHSKMDCHCDCLQPAAPKEAKQQEEEQQHPRKNLLKRVPFPLPKKLGSDRLLLVSRALDDIPQYRRHYQIQHNKSKNSTQSSSTHPEEHRVHFSFNANADPSAVVETIHEYEKDYDQWDRYRLWFSPGEFAAIFDRDDQDFAVCFNEMQHTKQILQLWGMCSRGTASTTGDNKSSSSSSENNAADEALKVAAKDLVAGATVIPNARGLEGRIITGIRNHRQKAVQSFLQADSANNGKVGSGEICPRYLKFSRTAARFSQALAEGDAYVAQQLHQESSHGAKAMGEADEQSTKGLCCQ